MDLKDKEDDYFLHNFDSNTRTDAGAGSGSGQTFDFSAEAASGNCPPKRRRHTGWIWFFAIVLLAIIVAVGIRYYIPYATDSQTTGYVTMVEKRGIIFKTYEGEMVSEQQLADTNRIYSREVFFSIPSDSLARELQRLQSTGKPVTIVCRRYYGTLPWRGAHTTVLEAIR